MFPSSGISVWEPTFRKEIPSLSLTIHVLHAVSASAVFDREDGGDMSLRITFMRVASDEMLNTNDRDDGGTCLPQIVSLTCYRYECHIPASWLRSSLPRNAGRPVPELFCSSNVLTSETSFILFSFFNTFLIFLCFPLPPSALSGRIGLVKVATAMISSAQSLQRQGCTKTVATQA
jgi:hypothetical protein